MGDIIKTHWLQNPNKNYLGHQDLPSGNDVILTIAEAGWEAVENPTLRTKEEKRVIHFVEKAKWLKPFICNETNARMIMKVTGEKYIEDSIGKKIKIGISKTSVKREEVDCLRVREVYQHELINFISNEQLLELRQLCKLAGKQESEVASILRIKSLDELPLSKFDSVKNKLNLNINQGENKPNQNYDK